MLINLDRYTILRVIQKVADEIGIDTYLVGGFTRNLILNKETKDIDIVCVGSGIELATEVAKKLDSNVKVFKNFGTAMLKYQDVDIEFVGARKESYSSNSRNPIVENGTLEDDQKRRDFTINTIYISLNKGSFGKIIDKFNGINDIKNKLIKTPLDPDITFSDDPLRMLRAIRFATQLNFHIDSNTLDAIQRNKNRLEIISAERISNEINQIILSSIPSKGFLLLLDTGLLNIILPELEALQGTETIEEFSHKDNFIHTLSVLDNVSLKSDNLWLRWAAILHDIAKSITKSFSPTVGFSFHGHEYLGSKMVPKIFKRLKLPLNHHMEYVKKLVKLHLRPIALVNDIVTDSAIRRLIYEAGDDLEDLMLLCRADITSNNINKINQYMSNFDKVEKKIKELEERDKIRNMKAVIDGEVIMRVLNLPPGKMVGEIKKEIKDAILEGKIKNEYEEAYSYMLDIYKTKR